MAWTLRWGFQRETLSEDPLAVCSFTLLSPFWSVWLLMVFNLCESYFSLQGSDLLFTWAVSMCECMSVWVKTAQASLKVSVKFDCAFRKFPVGKLIQYKTFQKLPEAPVHIKRLNFCWRCSEGSVYNWRSLFGVPKNEKHFGPKKPP